MQVAVVKSHEDLGGREAHHSAVGAHLHRGDIGAERHLAGEVEGGALLGAQYALHLKTLEYRLVQLVDGAGIYVLDSCLLEQGHCLDRGTEILADGHHHQVDAPQGQH